MSRFGSYVLPVVVVSLLVVISDSHAAELRQSVDFLVGDWQGRGDYQDNELAFSRSWSVVLANQFLRGDLHVTMPDGTTFSSIVFLQLRNDRANKAIWVDATGRIQEGDVRFSNVASSFSIVYCNDYSEKSPVWRRWTFTPLRENEYAEKLDEKRDGEWQSAGSFKLSRIADGATVSE